VPVEKIRRLALDEGSRTSVALTRILLAQRLGVFPELETLPIGATLPDTTADAVLLIGDRAIHSPAEHFDVVWDLGEEWRKWTGWSFVFAMWVARRDEVPPGIAAALSAARDLGLTQLDAIARHEAPRMQLDTAACLSYLRDNLYFHLGPRERQGLDLFGRYAAALGLAPALASA
jgi:chorismate dehydratase